MADTSHVVYIRFQGEDGGVKEIAVDAAQAIEGINVTINKTGAESEQTQKKSESMFGSLLKVEAVKAALNLVWEGIKKIGSSLGESMQLAADWEDKIAALGAAASDLDSSQVDELARDMQRLSQEIPVSADALMEIAEVAERMEFPEGEVRAFTETIGLGSKMFPEWSGGAKGLAQDVADLNRKYGEGADSTRGFLAVMDALSDKTNVAAQDIARFLDKFTMAPSFGLARDEAAALGATLMQLGVEGGGAATILNQLGAAVQTGGEKLEKMAEAAQMGVKEFESLAKESPYDALMAVAKGLGAAEKSGRGAAVTIREVARSEKETQDATKEYESAVTDAEKALSAMNAALESADNLLEKYNDTLDDAAESQRDADSAFADAANSFQDLPAAWDEYEAKVAALWEGIDNFTRAFSTDSETRQEIMKREGEQAQLWAEYQQKVNAAYERQNELNGRGIELETQAAQQQEQAARTLEEYYEQLARADEEAARYNELTQLAADLLAEMGPQYEAVAGEIAGAEDSSSALNDAMAIFGGESARALILMSENQGLLAENTAAAAQAENDQADYLDELIGITESSNATNAKMSESLKVIQTDMGTLLNDMLKPFKEALLEVGKTVSELTGYIPKMVEEWAKGNPTIAKLKEIWGEFQDSMDLVRSDLEAGEWESAWEEFKEGVSNAWGDIKPLIQQAWNEVIRPEVERILDEIIQMFADAAERAWNNFWKKRFSFGTGGENYMEDQGYDAGAMASYEYYYDYYENGGQDSTYLPPDDFANAREEFWSEDYYYGSSRRNTYAGLARQPVAPMAAGRAVQLHIHGLVNDGPSLERAAPKLARAMERAVAAGRV